ncbi:MAG: hypothetical protein ABIN80_02850 [Dyadobacter sp.]|uniref:hypothetical protein n=1 Tax=Dyadobacter sp. TaxID=1914288 RepID=UPI00326660C4
MRLLISFSLFLFAVICCSGLAVAALISTIVDSIRYKDRRNRLADSLFDGAYALDVYGNVAYPSLLNALFLKNGCYHFGRRDESISSVLGKNWTQSTLTWLGLGCAGFLNLLDWDHCFKSIQGAWQLPRPEKIPGHLTAVFSLILLAVLAIFSRLGFLIIFHA